MPAFQNPETQLDFLRDLGQIIRQKRKASGLLIDEAAALLWVSVDLLSRLENGKSGAKLTDMARPVMSVALD